MRIIAGFTMNAVVVREMNYSLILSSIFLDDKGCYPSKSFATAIGIQNNSS